MKILLNIDSLDEHFVNVFAKDFSQLDNQDDFDSKLFIKLLEDFIKLYLQHKSFL